MRNTPEIRLRTIAGQAGCESDIALLWALIQIYRQSQVFGSARLTDIADRLRVPTEVIGSTFDRLVDRGYALRTGDQLWLTQAGARQVDCASSALVSRIVDKLATSPTFEGRPDRDEVEAALERIAHQVLVQRDWRDDGAVPVAAAR
jgi:Mn-dependent DtxR family transcriptional regulator